ncbi:hypothetical protein [Streptomyces sp. URMC 123]|uniref:hypothetical protein n=1 Tax=Streptomyces sp. URMC 123 TaxID=3423403 RepID=UPI003F1BD525
MAWMYAQYVAEELVSGAGLLPPGTLEYRAGRDALALTVFLAEDGSRLSHAGVVSQLDRCLDLTAYDERWHEWCAGRLATLVEGGGGNGDGGAAGSAADGPDTGPDPGLPMALAAWRWLTTTELMAADAATDGPWHCAAVDDLCGEDRWMPAWRLGLPLAHLAVHLF